MSGFFSLSIHVADKLAVKRNAQMSRGLSIKRAVKHGIGFARIPNEGRKDV